MSEAFGPLTVFELPDSLKREGEFWRAECGAFQAHGAGPIEAFARLIDYLRKRQQMTATELRLHDEGKGPSPLLHFVPPK